MSQEVREARPQQRPIDVGQARRLALRCTSAQAVTTVVVALGCLVFGRSAALSALAGGGASTLAGLAMALTAFGRRAGTSAERVLVAFYVGELTKLIVVVVLLVLALRIMRAAPGPTFAAYAATFVVHWFVIVRAFLSGRVLQAQA